MRPEAKAFESDSSKFSAAVLAAASAEKTHRHSQSLSGPERDIPGEGGAERISRASKSDSLVSAHAVTEVPSRTYETELEVEPTVDEDADLDLEPGFSLLDKIRNSQTPRLSAGASYVLEVVRYRYDQILDVSSVEAGQVCRASEGSVAVLASFNQKGSARVQLPSGSKGVLWNVDTEGPRAELSAGMAYHLKPGDVLDLTEGEEGTLFRLVPRVEVETGWAVEDVKPSLKYALRLGGISAGAHAVIFALLIPLFVFVFSLLTHDSNLEVGDVDRFAELQIEMPEKKPEPPKKKKPAKRKKVAKTKPIPVKKRSMKVARKNAGQKSAPKNVAKAGIAGALGKLNLKFNTNAPLLAAATNLRGVRVPGGGGYKVSAFAVKGAKGVVNGRPGGAFGTVDAGTLNGQILGASGGAGGIKKRGSGKVRGQVAAPPARAVKVKGHLDRAQIAKVVNKHLHEIRHCYEKSLLRDPSLSGKVIVEWTIKPNGQVASAKTKYTSIRGGSVTGCITSRIRNWQFPRPKGNGRVVVNYPFMFESVGL